MPTRSRNFPACIYLPPRYCILCHCLFTSIRSVRATYRCFESHQGYALALLSRVIVNFHLPSFLVHFEICSSRSLPSFKSVRLFPSIFLSFTFTSFHFSTLITITRAFTFHGHPKRARVLAIANANTLTRTFIP